MPVLIPYVRETGELLLQEYETVLKMRLEPELERNGIVRTNTIHITSC
jgi:hypothetical protein